MRIEKMITVFSLATAGLVWTAMGMLNGIHTGDLSLARVMFPDMFSPESGLRMAAVGACLALGWVARTGIAAAHKTKNELKENERRFRLAFKATKDGLWDYNTQNDTVYFNDQYFEMLGYDAHELPRSYDTWKNLVHPDDRDRIINYIQKQIEKNEQYSVEFRMQTKSGDWMWILGRGQVMEQNDAGYPIRRVGTHADITARKEMEGELIKARKLESIGQLAGGMAHDYNNLLAVVIGSINLVQQDAELTPSSRCLLGHAEDDCQKATDLTKKLITFSEGGAPLKIHCDLKELIQDWAAEIFEISNRHCDISTADYPTDLECDPDQIKRAVQNILTNAHEATPDTGSIRIHLNGISFSSETIVKGLPISRGSYITIEIQDQGKGIKNDHLTRIFDPYFSTKPLSVQKGMGMGLTTAYSIVKKHDGYITVASEAKNGTRFRIYLPTKMVPAT